LRNLQGKKVISTKNIGNRVFRVLLLSEARIMTWANLGLSYSTRRGPSSFGPRKVSSYPCSAIFELVSVFRDLFEGFLPLKSSKNIEKSSFRFGSTTTRRELPILDFAFAKLNRANPNNKTLFSKNMWQKCTGAFASCIPRPSFVWQSLPTVRTDPNTKANLIVLKFIAVYNIIY